MSGKPHPAAVDVAGDWYLRNVKGALIPIEAVKTADLLMDEVVRDGVDSALAMSAALTAFKEQGFARVLAFQELLAQEHETAIGGVKGNIQLLSYDGCKKIQLATADQLTFGPELQAAKSLIDECVREWSAGSRVEIRALIDRVFSVDKEGQISHAGLFMLLHVGIEDERWLRAMAAIRGSIRVIGSKSYLRFYRRDRHDGDWRGIPLDLASA